MRSVARLGFGMWVCALVFLLYSSLILPGRLADQPCTEDAFHRKLGIESSTNFVYQSQVAKEKVIGEPQERVRHKHELDEKEAAIQERDRRIAVLEEKLRQEQETVAQKEAQLATKDTRIGKLKEKLHKGRLIKDMEIDGFRPLRVVVSHHPRIDMLGAFSLPIVFLLSVAYYWGWEMEVLPYRGSQGERKNKGMYAQGATIDKGWGTGFQDASFRHGYDPAEVNAQAYDNLGFFPLQPVTTTNLSDWTQVDQLPAPAQPELYEACAKNPIEGKGYLLCRLILPFNDDTGKIQEHMMRHGNGKLDTFITPSFRELMRTKFMKKNAHRLKHFKEENYNVAIHVRRGDVSADGLPGRWTEQSAFAALARHICQNHPSTIIHVFSSGKNEGNWTTLEQVKDTCSGVQFHLDEFEFDTWAHFVVADALVMSKSDFSYVPAFISDGDIYCPHSFGHPRLAHWHVFDNESGKFLR